MRYKSEFSNLVNVLQCKILQTGTCDIFQESHDWHMLYNKNRKFNTGTIQNIQSDMCVTV